MSAGSDTTSHSDAQPRTVFLLGAGANQLLRDHEGLPPPLGNGVLQEAARQGYFNRHRIAEWREALAYILKYWHRSRSSLVAAPFDLEECLTLLAEHRTRYTGEPDDLGAAWYQLLSLMGLLLARFTAFENSAFAHLCNLMRSATIITFNYDCFIESALDTTRDFREPDPLEDLPAEIGEWMAVQTGDPSDTGYYGHLWRQSRRLAYYPVRFHEVGFLFAGGPDASMPAELFYSNFHERGPMVLKLHGSLNWFRYLEPRHEWSRPDSDSVDRSGLLLCASEWSWRPPGHGPPEFRGWVVDPVIVPPTLDKAAYFDHPAYRELFRTLWHQATDALRNCGRLVIIGYSFAPTDFRTRRLFREAFAESSLSELIVVGRSGRTLDIARELTHFRKQPIAVNGVHRFVREQGWPGEFAPWYMASGGPATLTLHDDDEVVTRWKPRARALVVRWAAKPPTREYAYSVEVQADDGPFEPWMSSTRRTRGTYAVPDAGGTFRFRAQVLLREGVPFGRWRWSSSFSVPAQGMGQPGGRSADGL